MELMEDIVARAAQQADTFESFISRERERLNGQREEALAERQAADEKLAGIDRELHAVNAYEMAKQGKLNLQGSGQRQPRTSSKTGDRAPRGEKRQQILSIVSASSDGLTRGEILSKLGIVEKDNKQGAQSVSNALTNMVKGNQLGKKDGRYIAP